MQTTSEGPPAAVVATVFDAILVGIDGSPESLEAARQSARLKSEEGELTLVSVWDVPPPVVTPTGAYTAPEDVEVAVERSKADDRVRTACEHVGGVATRLRIVRGVPYDAIVRTALDDGSTMVAVGSHGQGRAYGILTASATTELVHKAPCSVLVSRNADRAFPRKIVVGVDGSPQSAVAWAIGRSLAERLSAEVRPIVGRGGGALHHERIAAILDGHAIEELPHNAVRALICAANGSDLVIVGSRGLRGPRALGSVSERVAHQAPCSVLIVR
jgi:nucleotide-binding universal stress UspA family protein